MDMCEWSQERFDDICKKMGSFLTKQVGFKESDLQFVPCSGLVGENLTTPSKIEKLTTWYTNTESDSSSTLGLSLIDCINRLKPSERALDKPLRFSISDVYKSSQSSSAISLAGKMESGSVKLGDRVVVVPANEIGLVKAILGVNDDISMQQCFAGDAVTLNVSGLDVNNVTVGSFICDSFSPPMPVTDRFKARIIIFGLEMPIIKGFSVVFHYKSMNEAAIIKKLISQLDKNTGEVVKEKPRLLTKGMSAIVEIKVNKPICIELFQNYRELGRFMLRYSGTTIAAGQIIEILNN